MAEEIRCQNGKSLIKDGTGNILCRSIIVWHKIEDQIPEDGRNVLFIEKGDSHRIESGIFDDGYFSFVDFDRNPMVSLCSEDVKYWAYHTPAFPLDEF